MKLIKIALAALALSVCLGCGKTVSSASSGTFSASFSDERYVWEQYQQSTNRVETTIR